MEKTTEMSRMVERVLSDLQRRWRWNADLMDCRECDRSIHVSRINETPIHGYVCTLDDGLNPWEVLATTIQRADPDFATPTTDAESEHD